MVDIPVVEMWEKVWKTFQAVFKGTFEYRVDAKGRLPVPAPFRRILESEGQAGVVVTHFDQCLAVYSNIEWARLESQLIEMPQFAKEAKALARRLASQATDCVLDSQGRILVPPILRARAGLEKDVTIVGVLRRFEIWPRSAWTTFLQESEHLLDDISLPASTSKL